MSRQDRIDRRNANDPTGYGGSLSCRPMVEAAIAAMRQYVGEARPLEIRWDRTGKQEFPVNGTIPTAGDLFGKAGRFSIAAPGAVGLLVDSVGFAYLIDGDDVCLDLDQLRVKGLAAMMPTSATGSQPAGIDPLTIAWTVFTLVRVIYGILNPKLSVLLGGNISLKATLDGSTLTIAFSECPSIKLVAFWEFHLAVTGAIVTAEKAVVSLHGNGLIESMIKQREFLFD